MYLIVYPSQDTHALYLLQKLQLKLIYTPSATSLDKGRRLKAHKTFRGQTGRHFLSYLFSTSAKVFSLKKNNLHCTRILKGSFSR